MGTARKINSFSISFGLVNIPVCQYVARDEVSSVHFNFLHSTCRSRLNQQLRCNTCEKPVPNDEKVRGLEIAKDRYVIFTDADFEALEADANKAIEIDAFVPLGSIDPVYFADMHLLGPDKGAERAYRLLIQAMLDTESAAIAQLVYRGKERLVCLRPYKEGLAMHSLYYESELRDVSAVPNGENVTLTTAEISMARTLVNQKSGDFRPETYTDSYGARVRDLAEKKAAGKEVEAPAAKPKTPVVDLMEALKQSIATPKKTRKRA